LKSTRINHAANDDEECSKPVDSQDSESVLQVVETERLSRWNGSSVTATTRLVPDTHHEPALKCRELLKGKQWASP
jgi:hypothetical protein